VDGPGVEELNVGQLFYCPAQCLLPSGMNQSQLRIIGREAAVAVEIQAVFLL
jgi:hypothetical protein